MHFAPTPLLQRTLIAIAGALTVLLTLSYSKPSLSAIYACQVGQNTVYQDAPCPFKKSPKPANKVSNGYPLAIHESWFEIPGQAQERAFCDRRGCECGRFVKKHQDSLIKAIADALYMDGSWHRYVSNYEAWLQTPASSPESFEAREHMLEASCDVMMSQTLLRKYADDAIAMLRKHMRTAEERGYDIEQPCLDGIPEACELFELVQYYKQIQADSTSLRRSRLDSL